MLRVRATFAVIVALLYASTTEAQDPFAGEWTMTSVVLKVNVESWGPNCGAQPKAYSSQVERPVTVTTQGGHIIIPDGQVRTDRCGSPNPKVQTVVSRRSDRRWKRECQTAKTDPKFESGVYTLTAINDNRLEYAAESRFAWTLKGDKCLVRSSEKRVFIRAQDATPHQPPPPSVPGTAPEVEIEPPAAPLPSDACEPSGPATKVDVSPKRVGVGPGEKFCFSVSAKDAAGCPIADLANVVWSVTQDGVPVLNRISRTGCFQAGDTAAETEGLYTVSARVGDKVGVAEISVDFVDLGELFAARLKPLEDAQVEPPPAQKKPTQNKNAPPPTSVVPPPTVAPAASRDTLITVVLPVIAGILGLLGIVLGTIVAIKLLRRRTAAEHAEFNDWPDAGFGPLETDPRREDAEMAPVEENVCPGCGRSFDLDAKFCPFDKITLVPSYGQNKDVTQGMICPKCHRGYDVDARFCPHDSEPLVPYAAWRISKKPQSPTNGK